MMAAVIAVFLTVAMGIVRTFSEDHPGSRPMALVEMNRLIDQTNFVVDDQCSGTLVSIKRRLVLSNYHCIEGKIKIVERDEQRPDGTMKKVRREMRKEVRLTQKLYKEYRQVGDSNYLADILAHDRKRDLVLLQLNADTIPHVVESRFLPDDRQITRGMRVYIVGNPAMLDASMVEGIVSSVNRKIEWGVDEIAYYFQFSGGVFGGNSGGAAYSEDGYFIGVPAAGNRWATHLGFAIPVSIVKAWLREECWAEVWDATAPTYELCKAEKAKAIAPGKDD